MNGKNESKPMVVGTGEFLQIAEVFFTLQGEGPFSGMPAIFVRLTGCNLRCHFCDTKWDDANDPQITVDDLTEKIWNLSWDSTENVQLTRLVVLTGGEPCRQPLGPLVHTLRRQGYQVQIETAGTYWQDCMLDEHVTLVCSPKTKHVHPKVKEYCNHWKYVTRHMDTSTFDGLPCQFTQEVDPKTIWQGNGDFCEKMAIYSPLSDKFGAPCRPPQRGGVTVWLSPCDEQDERVNKLNLKAVGNMCLKFGYRAQVQVHKLLNLR